MLKTRKERAYLIAILAVLAAIIGVIIFGLHLRRSAAKEAAAAATPRPTAEQKQGFSLVKEEETVVLETVQDGLKEAIGDAEGVAAMRTEPLTRFVEGLMLGGFFGIAVMALLQVASDADRRGRCRAGP